MKWITWDDWINHGTPPGLGDYIEAEVRDEQGNITTRRGIVTDQLPTLVLAPFLPYPTGRVWLMKYRRGRINTRLAEFLIINRSKAKRS